MRSQLIANGGAWLLRNRRLVRAPIWIYRLRLGFLFGARMLLLEHIGRNSGQPRQVVLEVVGHPAPRTYVVVSGFGERAQWFRNVRANPPVRISVGSRAPAPATARVLTGAEADEVLRHYVAAHRRAWAAFRPIVETTLGEEIHQHDTALPMVAFELDG